MGELVFKSKFKVEVEQWWVVLVVVCSRSCRADGVIF